MSPQEKPATPVHSTGANTHKGRSRGPEVLLCSPAHGLGWQLAHSCNPYVFPKCWCSSVQATPSLACGCSGPSCLCSKHVSYRLSRSLSQDLTQVQPYLAEAAGRLFTLLMESFFAGKISKKMASTLWQSSCLRLQNAGITGMSQYSQVLYSHFFFRRDNFSIDEIDSPVFFCVVIPCVRKPVLVRM